MFYLIEKFCFRIERTCVMRYQTVIYWSLLSMTSPHLLNSPDSVALGKGHLGVVDFRHRCPLLVTILEFLFVYKKESLQ